MIVQSMPQESFLILVGTQTGNAERVALEMETALVEQGREVDLVDMWDAYPEMLGSVRQLVVCTSTWGDGELPDNAVDFVEDLEALRPSLDHVSYGIVALGDHHYDPHFCGAARTFESILDSLGATRALNTLEFDEGPDADDLRSARLWVIEFSHLLSDED